MKRKKYYTGMAWSLAQAELLHFIIIIIYLLEKILLYFNLLKIKKIYTYTLIWKGMLCLSSSAFNIHGNHLVI